MDEIDQILQDTTPQAATAGAAPSTDEIDSILGEMPVVDDIFGTEVPEDFNGADPSRAINKSPLTALDRFNLGLGNVPGNIKYLAKRFDEVQPINGTQELAVRDAGKWYRVDPGTGTPKDPWELAKDYAQNLHKIPLDAAHKVIDWTLNPEELVGDVADIGGTVGTTAIGAAAAAPLLPASGPVGYAAGAGMTSAALRTSLGRIAGTYDATPSEQAWDIAFESILNAGGAKVALHVKPTAKWVANKLDGIADAFKETAVAKGISDAASLPKAGMKKLFSAFSVGEDNFDTMLQHTPQVKAAMNDAYGRTGSNTAAYHDDITMNQVEHVKNFAQNTRKTLSMIYDRMSNKILNSVDDNFSANYDEAIHGSYSEALQSGIGKITVNGQTLVGAEAVEYLAKNGSKGTKFEVLTQAEMKNAIRSGSKFADEVGYLATDKDAYEIIKNFYGDLGAFAGSTKRSGREAAEALLQFKKIQSDRAWSLSNLEKVRDLPGVKSLLDKSRLAMDRSVRQSLDKAGIAGDFDKLNTTYSSLSESFAPILNANYRFKASGDMKVYEQLLGQFTSKPGKNVTKKYAMDAAIDAADEHGITALSNVLKKAKLDLQVGEAAKAFNPLADASKKAGLAQVGMATYGAYMATQGQPALGTALMTAGVVGSPKFAQMGIYSAQTLAKAQELLAKMPTKQVKTLMSDSRAQEAFMNGVTSGLAQRVQASQDMEQVLQSQVQGQ